MCWPYHSINDFAPLLWKWCEKWWNDEGAAHFWEKVKMSDLDEREGEGDRKNVWRDIWGVWKNGRSKSEWERESEHPVTLFLLDLMDLWLKTQAVSLERRKAAIPVMSQIVFAEFFYFFFPSSFRVFCVWYYLSYLPSHFRECFNNKKWTQHCCITIRRSNCCVCHTGIHYY